MYHSNEGLSMRIYIAVFKELHFLNKSINITIIIRSNKIPNDACSCLFRSSLSHLSHII